MQTLPQFILEVIAGYCSMYDLRNSPACSSSAAVDKGQAKAGSRPRRRPSGDTQLPPVSRGGAPRLNCGAPQAGDAKLKTADDIPQVGNAGSDVRMVTDESAA